jgi:uncharacterized protein (TIGR02147 family)
MSISETPFHLKQLEKTFENRIKMNARYSLRAFARDLGISAPRLSGILNRKFGLSRAAAQAICKTLGYDAKTAETFIHSVEAHHHRSPKSRAVAQMKLAGRQRVFHQLELERFAAVSEWYHFALMELTRFADLAPNDAKAVAQELGISSIAAKTAIARLLELNLLKIENNFLKTTGSYLVGNHTPSAAIRALNTQLLGKASAAIENQSVTERDLRTLTLSITKAAMPEFTQLFNQFQKKVRDLAEKNSEKDAVYAWTMQFFKLSEEPKKEIKS